MKKTLVALAVLAASGASFAQVTISGNLTMGYQATTTGGVSGVGATDAAGLGTDTSEIDFMATEDLGGGMKAIAKLALAGADRSGESGVVGVAGTNKNGSVTGRDASLSLVTSAGVIGLASVSAADYLSGGLAGVGTYYNDFSGKVFSARTNRDVLSYSIPMGAWTPSFSYQETSVAANQGLGVGTTGSATVVGQSLVTAGVSYAQGAAAANFTYLNFNSKEATAATRDQTRLSGSYDFGAVKLGLGAVLTNVTNLTAGAANQKVTDLALGLKAPIGAMTVGGQLVSRKYDDALGGAAMSGTATGAELQISYALSKRTSMIGNYARWTQTGGTGIVAGQDASNQYNLLLSHSF